MNHGEYMCNSPYYDAYMDNMEASDAALEAAEKKIGSLHDRATEVWQQACDQGLSSEVQQYAEEGDGTDAASAVFVRLYDLAEQAYKLACDVEASYLYTEHEWPLGQWIAEGIMPPDVYHNIYPNQP